MDPDQATYVPVGRDRVFALGPNSFEELSSSQPGSEAWAWRELPMPSFDPRGVASYAVHPDGRAIFFSTVAGWNRGAAAATFCFDASEDDEEDRFRWTRHGEWALPFVGPAHYDRALDAWVGLANDPGAFGHVCACDVVPPDAAVVGPTTTATARTASCYKRIFSFGDSIIDTGMQYGWFEEMLKRIAPGDGARRRLLAESLIVFGEIGSSDYVSWFNAGGSREKAKEFMPMVVSAISTFLEWVIYLSAKVVMIPNNFPIGCLPSFLSRFHSHEPKDYDEHGCLRWFNDFTLAHNLGLFEEVNWLQLQYPDVKLIYADYYNATMELLKNPDRFGFGDPLVACCGGDGPYHTSMDCNKKAKVWGDPDRFVSWDGIRMTEKAYNIIVKGVLKGPFANPPLLRSCSN
ncbi:hypothetical protein QOZ80_3AG0216230 [Eleusine coracana subsp. coracana]|nr:hypothetical protein QOZ80_3AG0216230 [Eleusine coracana subsp. coracana]